MTDYDALAAAQQAKRIAELESAIRSATSVLDALVAEQPRPLGGKITVSVATVAQALGDELRRALREEVSDGG